MQSATENRRGSHTMSNMARPFCADCNKYFGRVQELKRHLNDVHMPLRGCPFCDVKWTRPDKIKAHLMANHEERFTAGMLEQISALYGRRLVECLDTYNHCPDIGETFLDHL